MSQNPRERVHEALDIYHRYRESYLTRDQKLFTQTKEDRIEFFKSKKGEFVSIKKIDSGIEISITKNVSDLHDSIKEKIFLPFFTTKPTGSGTGLGLSLSYDIVKAHGGKLDVESTEGQGTWFVISLPAIQTEDS